jgi:adenosylcobinamide kinase/adenosylcobinamide-phosphate guanylyltransferase
MAHTELILGGQKSGKSARAEQLAQSWLAQSPDHRGVFIATAQAWDEEMQMRILRHQADRALRLPQMQTLEEPLALAQALTQYSSPNTLIVIDCITLWLVNFMMPMETTATAVSTDVSQNASSNTHFELASADFFAALKHPQGPVILVSNEIGLGVIPMGKEVRKYVDALGCLNQELARICDRVSLMAAGLALTLKEPV